ncbi:MAG: succinate dehydrogenase [SAR324 cluster bacterium]|nr:succinate dehydrogenase [SAR324 cluster bacterium]
MGSDFLLRRIHSITGIVPVGLFLIYHLYTQLYLHHGAEVYNQQVNGYYDSPLAILALVIFVYIPLIFHSVYGLKISSSLANPSEIKATQEYKYFSNLLYWLQRLSGVGVFLFVVAHLANAQIIPLMNGEWGAHYEHLQGGFLNPSSGWLTLTVYILGITGAAFHLGNGISTFCMTWGIALTPLSQKMVRTCGIGVFFVLVLSGYYSISVFWLN